MFNVGDNVKNIKNLSCLRQLDVLVGCVGKITAIDKDSNCSIHVRFNNNVHEWFNEEELELFNKSFLKSDLKERYIVEFRCGSIAVVGKDSLNFIVDGHMNNTSVQIRNYNDDLTNTYYDMYDVVKVFKPEYKEIYTRIEKPVKVVTMNEVYEKFGCKVEIKPE